MDVYINDISAFLPGEPIDNDNIERVLGEINDVPSGIKQKILRNNGIKTRYYGIDPETKEITHTNTDMVVETIKALKPYDGFNIEDIECICCGTSSPDVILPGHGLMVHGELANSNCEVVTTSGICLCGITALKYAWMNVAMGFSNNAVATGSEHASSYMRTNFFSYKGNKNIDADIDNNPNLAFESDFLRWMLSDAAGAVFLSNKKSDDKLSLKIDWIEHTSFANEYDTCMWAGGNKDENGKMVGWRYTNTLEESMIQDCFALKQDVQLLQNGILKISIDKGLAPIVKKRNLKADEVDWLLPHYSSDVFRSQFKEGLENIDFDIPFEKWFTNLTTKGNTGSASIYVMLEELFKSGKLEKGQKVLCFIPESGRFSVAYMMLTVE